MKKVNVLGVWFDSLTIAQANEQIIDHVRLGSNKEPIYVVKPYVEFLTKAYKNAELTKILNNANLVLADGVSIQWAASYLYGKPHKKFLKLLRSLIVWLQNPLWRQQILPQKMAGVNQTIELLRLADKSKLRIGVIGGNSTPQQIQKNLNSKFSKLGYIQCWSGYYNPKQEQEIVQQMRSAKLDILFVAMGFPLQEKFIAKHISSYLAKVCIGEGGSFDYNQLSGKIRRAPQKIQDFGLEWLWRLWQQPSRLLRQLAIPKFIYLVYKQSKRVD